MRTVLDDMLNLFEQHIQHPPWREGMMETGKFYKNQGWLPEARYMKLLAEFEFHLSLVEDLCFELTRYGNLLATIVRSDLDPSYRLQQGALVIRYGLDLIWFGSDSPIRPEFTLRELELGKQPYTGIDEFIHTRTERASGAIQDGSPRTMTGHQKDTPT